MALQDSLFDNKSDDLSPLSYRIRPTSKDDYIGIKDILKQYPFLGKSELPSLVIWGPPGCGKTTLAKVLSQGQNVEFESFSAVMGGIPELKKLIAQIQENLRTYGKKTILFIDEIHRFNKSQQDALLPHVESGAFILIGATTENPRSSLNRALLSRVQTIELKHLNFKYLEEILTRACLLEKLEISDEEKEILVNYCDGDARKILNNLEILRDLKSLDHYSITKLKDILKASARSYDKNGDRHYDVISAFIKSMRGSDPDAAILWLAVMLDGGEDPVFIARRLVIFASEDVGNADIGALNLAVNALSVVSQIGMPEARITLAQATTYLASTVKSNRAYEAINDALTYVKDNSTLAVPEHLRNFPNPNHNIKYQYPHDGKMNFINQQYAPQATPQFYFPTENGVEKNIKERLRSLWKNLKNYV